MSTNKTQNYQLHAWELEDDFLLSEMNENFEKLDGSAVQIVFGTYAGSGEISQTIQLGFPPRAVLVMRDTGEACWGGRGIGGLSAPGMPAREANQTFIQVGENSFTVFGGSSGGSIQANVNTWSYYYLAFR